MSDFVSGRLLEYKRRADLIPSSRAEYRPEHFRFARAQALYTPPLAKARPIESIGRNLKLMGIGLAFGAAIIATMWILGNLAEWVG